MYIFTTKLNSEFQSLNLEIKKNNKKVLFLINNLEIYYNY